MMRCDFYEFNFLLRSDMFMYNQFDVIKITQCVTKYYINVLSGRLYLQELWKM